jgi:hypothetical protein
MKVCNVFRMNYEPFLKNKDTKNTYCNNDAKNEKVSMFISFVYSKCCDFAGHLFVLLDGLFLSKSEGF